jgi:intracellular sulfur oxidation DsrE/DsrF family protein
MKHPIIYVVVLVLFATANKATAQTGLDPGKQNYLVLSKNIEQLNPILLTANSLSESDGGQFGEFHVVFCGKTVTKLPDNKGIQRLLDKAEKMGAKVFVCGLSLQKFGIAPEALPKGISVVDNGIFYGFQLQKKGFNTLTI